MCGVVIFHATQALGAIYCSVSSEKRLNANAPDSEFIIVHRHEVSTLARLNPVFWWLISREQPLGNLGGFGNFPKLPKVRDPFTKSGFSQGRVPKYNGFSQGARKKFFQGRHTLSYSRDVFLQYQISLFLRLIGDFRAFEFVACNVAL